MGNTEILEMKHTYRRTTNRAVPNKELNHIGDTCKLVRLKQSNIAHSGATNHAIEKVDFAALLDLIVANSRRFAHRE